MTISSDGKNRIRYRLLIWLPIAAFFAALIIVGSHFDWQISEAIARLNGDSYFTDNFFANAFESFGELPVYFLIAFFCGIFARYLLSLNGKKIYFVAAFLFAVAAIAVSAFSIGRAIKQTVYICGGYEWYESNKFLARMIAVFGGTVVSVCIGLVIRKIKSEYLLKLCVFGAIFVLAAVISQGMIKFVIKPLCGRMRYRSIIYLFSDKDERMAAFTPWWKLNSSTDKSLAVGLLDEMYKSFPSGHTCIGAMLIALGALPPYLTTDRNKARKASAILYIVGLAYTATIAISRIVAGAHYLTDVAIGAVITIFSIIISEIIVKTLVKKFKLL